MTTIKELHELKMRAANELQALVDATPAAEWTAETDEVAERMNTEITALTNRIKLVQSTLERDADLTETQRNAVSAESAPAAPTIEAQLRSFLKGETNAKTFTVPAVQRDLTAAGATTGAPTIPISFYDQLVEHMIEVSAVMNAGATVIRTAGGEKIRVPATTSYSTAGLVAEGAAIPESDPATAQRDLDAYKYAHMVQVSNELIQDTGVDLLGFLARQSGRAVGNGMGAHLVTGTGSSQPQGVVTAATVGVAGAAAAGGAFTADNLIDLYYSVIAPYRMSPACGWLMDDTTVAAVRKLKDAQGQYLWVGGIAPGAPDTLLGKPIYTDPNVAGVAVDARSVAFGDMSAYFVRMVNEIRFERSDDFAFANDLVTFRCIVRGDGVLADTTGAVKCFVGGAAS